ncbi:hypothetical protein C8J56DRAFT_834156 [Mycena floridula]|nr:hypothetical protein C8J56DRAFT_834156 [Mycena floridula]
MSAVSTSRYAFLSKPPQKQPKKRPVKLQPVHPVNVVTPLPVSSPPIIAVVGRRPRSSTFSSITTWALTVQPGSPAPRTPPSARRRASSVRRPRVSHSRACSTSSSFLRLVDTPTTAASVKDNTFDLTTLGYTSVFVNLPTTPATPSPRLAMASKAQSKLTLKRFRSVGVLKRPRSKSTSSNGPPSPRKPASPTKKTGSPTRPRSKSVKALPPTFNNELLLLQLMDGGSLEHNMKRVMEKQAKRAAKTLPKSERPIADAHRDASGNFWVDQDEEMEYAPLLASTEDEGWVQFDGEVEEVKELSSLPIPTVTLSGRPASKNRRRPAPLDLAAAQPASVSSGFDDSFAPEPVSAPAATLAIPRKSLKKQMSRLNVLGLFRA